MFALSVTFKLMVWVLALKHGDSGPSSRPWTFGVCVGIVFAGFDVLSEYSRYQNLQAKALTCLAYLVIAVTLMNIYYRNRSIGISLLVAAVGTLALFFGVPYFIALI